VVDEPHLTAWLLTLAGTLLAFSVLLSRASGRLGVPTALLFLCMGMLAGEEGIGGIVFDDYRFAFRAGTVALVFILFDGGFNTPLAVVRRGMVPAGVLATIGVALTAGLVALGARLLGMSWSQALLVGAVVSSTDAAAVFSILRASGLNLKQRVGTLLELESGLNDPMAVLLTLALTDQIVGGGKLGWGLARDVVVQLAIGAVVGMALGRGGRFALRRTVLPVHGLYPVFTLGLALLTFGAATLLGGSGFLAVYLAAAFLGGGALPYHTGLRRVHDAVAWFAQVVMFLLLGLLVQPSKLIGVAGQGLALGLFLCVIARPAAVMLCLLPFRLPWREQVFLSWVGLRGAVPIVLATFPVLAGVPAGRYLFDVVFFVVVVSVLLQGGTVKRLMQALGLESGAPPPPPAVLEIASVQQLEGELMSFYIREASAVAGSPLAEIPFPGEASVVMVVRGRTLIAPRGSTVLRAGDHVYVVCQADDRDYVRLIMGQQLEE
jgi:cell volume regulation protein A